MSAVRVSITAFGSHLKVKARACESGLVRASIQDPNQQGSLFDFTLLDVPVSILPAANPCGANFQNCNGTFGGEATNTGRSVVDVRRVTTTSCPGSLSGYQEAAVVSVNRAGTGSITMMDTPGFNREYD